MNGLNIELNSGQGSMYMLRRLLVHPLAASMLINLYRCVAIDPIDGVM
jgi:hypothetical protein